MKRLKKYVSKLINNDQNSVIKTFVYKLLVIYRKLRYFRYKYKFDVDNGMILFVFKNKFDGTLKELYEKMLYDEEYNGFQFILSFKNPKEEKYKVKDPTTVIIKKKSKAFMKFSSKSKYWIRDGVIDLHITPKREQVVSLVNNLEIKTFKYINTREKKYIKRHVDCLINESIHKDKKLAQQIKTDFYNKKHVNDDKILIYYKIFFEEFNEFFYNDFFSNDFLKRIYKKYKNKYQFLIDVNFDIQETFFKKYKNFFVDASKCDEKIVNLCTDILITNKIEFIEDNNDYSKNNKFLYSNFKYRFSKYLDKNVSLYNGCNVDELIKYLDRYNNKKPNKKYLALNYEFNNLCHDIILLKNKKHHTITFQALFRKFGIPTAELLIKIRGFFRTRGLVISKNSKLLKQYRNAYKGKRCILIGNGPSLTYEDLNMVKDEITFGCNFIYKIYDNTDWRPTFLCVADGLYTKKAGKEMIDNMCCDTFMVSSAAKTIKNTGKDYNIIKLDSISTQKNNKYKVVSPLAYHYPGGTVMSMMLCLAIYMGFDEIYLLGVDCTSSLSQNGHFIKGYMNSNIRRLDMKRIAKRLKKNIVTEEEVAKYYYDRVINVYEIINQYVKKKNVKIYNATRGGALEVYERKNLEEIL